MEFTGKTSEEAIELALKELGITREQAQIEILEEGSGVLFFKKKARVNVTVREDDAQRTLNFLDGLFADSCEIGLYSWGVHFAPTKEKRRFTDKSYKEVK